ncbi:MAG: hypothetical protein JRN32_00955 [Nitrososphaerota archaeon]|nr:hypothetical protein [Nitrososphaerota archaeon]MDG7045371.1 hypothetical protein [Nitrososphaerota archaeon]
MAKPGMKKGEELTEDKVNLNSYSKYLVNAPYLQHMIRAGTGININYKRIKRVKNASGLSSGAERRKEGLDELPRPIIHWFELDIKYT